MLQADGGQFRRQFVLFLLAGRAGQRFRDRPEFFARASLPAMAST